jgi:hypothetical protein
MLNPLWFEPQNIVSLRNKAILNVYAYVYKIFISFIRTFFLRLQNATNDN